MRSCCIFNAVAVRYGLRMLAVVHVLQDVVLVQYGLEVLLQVAEGLVCVAYGLLPERRNFKQHRFMLHQRAVDEADAAERFGGECMVEFR